MKQRYPPILIANYSLLYIVPAQRTIIVDNDTTNHTNTHNHNTTNNTHNNHNTTKNRKKPIIAKQKDIGA